jgi:hypothetical protein
MYRGLHCSAVALIAASLCGCVQATRHSNTMLFGTNTQFGIRAGASASSVPELNIGYTRQEAVVMPLVANAKDDGKYQTPCDPSQPVDAQGGTFAVHPCLLVGVNGSAQDSYSVLASFGAKFDAGAQASGVQSKGGLAQYFATGMAAQILALNGGASVVATGDAATESAKTKPSSSTVAALFGNEANYARGVGYRTSYDRFKARLLAKIELTKPDDLQTKISSFEGTAGAPGRGIAEDCTSAPACKKAVIDNDAYRDIYPLKESDFDAALAAWKVE